MNINSVRLYNPEPSSGIDPMIFSLDDPAAQNPYQVTSMQGLDADEIAQRFYGLGGSGNRLYSPQMRKREVVILLSLNPLWSADQTYSDLRDQAYRIIASSRSGLVTIGFFLDDVEVANVAAMVTKMETNHFNKNPELQITLECKDAMLRAPSPVEVPDVELLDPASTVITDDVSTAPHGAIFSVKFVEEVLNFGFKGPIGTWEFTMTPATGIHSFDVDDVLTVNSSYMNRSVILKRGGQNYPLADIINFGSIWPVIFPGDNTIICDEGTVVIWEKIEYTHAYWGV